MREQFSPKSSVLNTTCTTCSATKEEEKRFFFFLEEKTWSWKIFAPFLFSSSLSLSFIFYFEKNDRRSRCFSILHRHWTFLLVQLELFSCFSFPHPLFLSFDPWLQVSRGFLRAFEGWRGLDDDDDDEATRGENSLSRNGSGGETFPAPQGTLMIALTRLGNRGRLSTITELSPFRRSPSWPFRPRGSWYPTIDSNYR